MDTNAKEVAVVKDKVGAAEAEAQSIVVTNDEELALASTFLTNVRKLAKFVEQEKKKMTDPMREALENARAFFKPFEEGAARAEALVKSRAVSYQVEKQRKADIEEARIAARVEKGTMKEETGLKKLGEVDQVQKKVEVAGGGATQLTYTTKFDVEDEGKVPDEYWVLDMVKIGKVVRAGGTIAGIKITKVPNMAIKTS